MRIIIHTVCDVIAPEGRSAELTPAHGCDSLLERSQSSACMRRLQQGALFHLTALSEGCWDVEFCNIVIIFHLTAK